ncbi:hypothetical protein BASA81_005763 [Batrachochytrium salamandrivorans]|nr:hypothetical protein BASA81_005763 [Batrachochytrium salamandrivorans]
MASTPLRVPSTRTAKSLSPSSVKSPLPKLFPDENHLENASLPRKPKTNKSKKKPVATEQLPTTTTTTTATTTSAKEVAPKTTTVLSQVYKIITKHHGLAYGTPNSPIYGENNKSSMTRAFKAMGLGEDEGVVFCDVGSGTGAPSLHAACEYPGILSYGFELMGSRWWISQTILNDVLCNKLTAEVGSRVLLAHVDLGDLVDFGPCTHVFAFDTGFPLCALELFGKAVNQSHHIKVLGSFHKLAVLEKAGFKNLELQTKVKMTMSGSSEGKQLLVYRRSRDQEDEDTKDKNWNLTRLCPVPSKSEFQPTVAHGVSYVTGEEERVKGRKPYQAWVQDQIGFHRQASMGVKTRAATRRAMAEEGEKA